MEISRRGIGYMLGSVALMSFLPKNVFASKNPNSDYQLSFLENLLSSAANLTFGRLFVAGQGASLTMRKEVWSGGTPAITLYRDGHIYELDYAAKAVRMQNTITSTKITSGPGAGGGRSVLRDDQELSRRLTNREKYLDRNASRWEVTENNGQQGIVYKWSFIVDDELEIPLSIVKPGRYSYCVTGISLGVQNRVEFEIPSQLVLRDL